MRGWKNLEQSLLLRDLFSLKRERALCCCSKDGVVDTTRHWRTELLWQCADDTCLGLQSAPARSPISPSVSSIMTSNALLVFLACCLLVVTFTCAQMKLSIQKRGEMAEGKEFSLSCLVGSGDHKKDDTYVWRNNHEPLSNKKHQLLQFPALARSDVGTYDCGYNNSGTMVYSRLYDLTFPYRPVVHIALRVNDFNASIVLAGFDVYLTCNVTATEPDVPPDQYGWWYSKTCQDGAGALLAKENTASVLEIKRVKPTDEGCYTCTAINEAELSNNASKLLVVHYLENPCISVDPAVMVGDNTRVNCTVSSNPDASLALYKNGKLLRKTVGDVLSHPIHNVSFEHRGTYVCKAENDLTGTSNAVTTDLMIQHEPLPLGRSTNLTITVKAHKGDTVNLVVQFEANPQPTISWSRDGPDRVVFENAVQTSNSSTLTVEAVPARFRVTISNHYGALTRTFQVLVDDRDVAGINPRTPGIIIDSVIGVFLGAAAIIVAVYLYKRWKSRTAAPPEPSQGPEDIPLRNARIEDRPTEQD